MLVANQATDNIVVYTVDPDDGHLATSGTELAVEKPMCLKFYLSK